MNISTRIAILVAVGAVLMGCKNDEKMSLEDPFFPPDNVTPPSKLMQHRQVANGAAADAMLFDVHFDGGELNSLGTQKLGLMVEGKRPNLPLKVFLNMPKDAETSAARETAVAKSLETSGLPKDQFAVTFGPNPNVLMPADAGIRALQPAGNTADDVKKQATTAE